MGRFPIKYDGEVCKQLKPHGRGTCTFADGNKYEGQWENGVSRQGTMTYTNGAKYKGQWKNAQKHGKGTFTLANGAKYEGDWEKGEAHGTGTKTYTNGDTYDGQWEKGDKYGTGTQTYANGDTYDGQWENDRRHGTGTMTFASGNKYEGQWDNDMRHGVGTYTHANGDKYHGEWEKGEEHGTGTYTYANGAKYEGQFEKGKAHGTGTFTYANGDKYEGDWEKGKAHGTGTMTYANGDKYEGQWEKNELHTGTYTYADGATAKGQWKNGMRHGWFTITCTNGDKYDCEWQNGKLTSTSLSWHTITMKYADGGKYDGEWKNGMRNGTGTMTYANGDKYEGDWVNDKKPGTGTMTYANGDKYEGDWENGMRHGSGRYTNADGDTYEGQWKNDFRHGTGTKTYANHDPPVTYEGQWVNDKKQGTGTITYANGDTWYEGDWENGMRHGSGRYTDGDGDTYDGEWKNDRENGTGTVTMTNGDKYEGQWENGRAHGTGTYTYASGDKYEGQWENGNEHGTGTYTHANGDKYHGEWEKGEEHGTGTFTWTNGEKYEGQWVNGQRHGRGTNTYANGYKYHREWQNGKLTSTSLISTRPQFLTLADEVSLSKLDTSGDYAEDLCILNSWSKVHLSELQFQSEQPDGHCYYYAMCRQLHPSFDDEADPATWAKQTVLAPMFRTHARRIFADNKPEPTTVDGWFQRIKEYLKPFMAAESFDRGYMTSLRNAANFTILKGDNTVGSFFKEAASRIYKKGVRGRNKLFTFVNELDISLMQNHFDRPIYTFQVSDSYEVTINCVRQGAHVYGMTTAAAIAAIRSSHISTGQRPLIFAYLRANGSCERKHYGSGILQIPDAAPAQKPQRTVQPSEADQIAAAVTERVTWIIDTVCRAEEGPCQYERQMLATRKRNQQQLQAHGFDVPVPKQKRSRKRKVDTPVRKSPRQKPAVNYDEDSRDGDNIIDSEICEMIKAMYKADTSITLQQVYLNLKKTYDDEFVRLNKKRIKAIVIAAVNTNEIKKTTKEADTEQSDKRSKVERMAEVVDQLEGIRRENSAQSKEVAAAANGDTEQSEVAERQQQAKHKNKKVLQPKRSHAAAAAVSIVQANAAVRKRQKVSLFDPCAESKKPQMSSKQEVVFEPDTIKSKRVIAGCVEYKVSWKGYDESEDTWEPVEHCMQQPALKALVHEFRKQMYAKVKAMWHADRTTMINHICGTFATVHGDAFVKSELATIETMAEKVAKTRATALARQMSRANANSDFADNEIRIGEEHQCAVIPMCGGSLDRRDLARAGTPLAFVPTVADQLAREAYRAYACSQPADSGALEEKHLRVDAALHEDLIKIGCIRATNPVQPRKFVNLLFDVG